MSTPITKLGFQQLTDELEQLQSVERPQIVEAIAEARSHGDLKENAEYHSAKDKQGLVEARIRYLKAVLSTAEVIDIADIAYDGRVKFGVTVTVEDTETEDSRVYQIVGVDEADIALGKISVVSPVSRALMGKAVGDVIEVKTPKGVVEYEILAIKH